MRKAFFVFLLCIFALVQVQCRVASEGPFYFTQQCDHFNALRTNSTFQQKYFLNDTFWSGPDSLGPILFSPGGEASMSGIYYGFMREFAQQIGGLILFVEHRFYGESLPFGVNSWKATADHLGLLSIEQAMADYITIITNIKTQLQCPSCPVAAFGGSYSGVLSTYLRLKYPTVIDFSLAASAPIFLNSPNLVSQFEYYKIVTEATQKLSPLCPDAIRNVFSVLRSSSPEEITDELNLCYPLSSNPDLGICELEQRIINQFADMAMANYPPQKSPITLACNRLLNGSQDLSALRRFLDDSWKLDIITSPPQPPPPPPQSLSILLVDDEDKNQIHPSKSKPNSNPQSKSKSKSKSNCYNISSAAPAGKNGRVVCSDWSGCGGGFDGESWDYQACTEVIQNLGTNNITDMFPPRNWTLDWLTNHCQLRFGATPLAGGQWLALTMGLADLKKSGLSHVIFSNGMQDPWKAGGVLNSLSETLIAIQIPNGAHHQDLSGSSPDDTPDMVQARKQEMEILTGWIEEKQRQI